MIKKNAYTALKIMQESLGRALDRLRNATVYAAFGMVGPLFISY